MQDLQPKLAEHCALAAKFAQRRNPTDPAKQLLSFAHALFMSTSFQHPAASVFATPDDAISAWYREACSNATSSSISVQINNSVKLHNIAYAVSPYLRIRFRVSHPVLVQSDLLTAAGDRVIRDVTLTFDDDDVMPGESVSPLVQRWTQITQFYGVSEQQLQKSVLRLQKLVAGELGIETAQNPQQSPPKPTTTAAADPDPENFKPQTTTGTSSRSNTATATTTSHGQKADVNLLYMDPDKALKDVDLNDADELTLQEYKDMMTERFKDKVLKPGDPGYEYDKRVDFRPPTKKSEWDDSGEDDF